MDPQVLERALERERKRRAAAEALLEEKSRELYHSYRELEQTLEELQRNRDALIQSEKMASLGVMSAGVAHEINTPIGYIQSNLNTLGAYAPVLTEAIEYARKLADEHQDSASATALNALCDKEDIEFVLEDTADIVADSRSGIERVRNIVEGLNAFSGKNHDEHSQIDINEVLGNALAVAQGQFDACEIKQSFGDVPNVQGSAARLGQALVNLIVNAGQSLTDAEEGVISISSRLDDEWIVIEVTDNGCGIAEDIQQKIFEPFFTTRDVGAGTGLGLSVSLGIIQDHQGQMTCDSEIGRGSNITVRLPASV